MQIGCRQGRRRRRRPQIQDPSATYRASNQKQRLIPASCKITVEEQCRIISSGGPDWSALPIDVLLVILGRLPIKDYLRFSAVCGSWNRAAATRLVPPAPSLPWLMANPAGVKSLSVGKSLVRAMLDPLTAEEHCRIKLLPHNKLFVSTADGYIIYLDNKSELLIMNPMTRSRIPRLPSTTTLPNPPNNRRWELKEAALLRRQSTTLVALSCSAEGGHGHLAFSRPGDKTWTFLADPALTYAAALIFHKGLLYALYLNIGTMIWDFRGDHPPRPMPTLAPKDNNLVMYNFLVESSTGDDLYQVLGRLNGKHTIFKLQTQSPTCTSNWCAVTALSGDDVLMLSPHRALCVSARDFPVLRPNCIYSTLYYMPSFDDRTSFPTPLCVFNLGNGTRESLPIGRYITNYMMDWFSPHLFPIISPAI